MYVAGDAAGRRQTFSNVTLARRLACPGIDAGGRAPLIEGDRSAEFAKVGSISKRDDRTVGLDARTHKKTFELDQGGYTPVVSDGKRLYLVGYFSLIGLDPTKH